MEEFVDKPYEALKQRMVCFPRSNLAHGEGVDLVFQRDGTALPCFCSMLLDEAGDKLDEQRDFDIRWTANSMYSASLDTVRLVSHLRHVPR